MMNDIDKMLNERHIAPPASNLAARIIEQARPHSAPVSIFTRIREMMVLDMPAVAMAACLVLGLAIGIYSSSSTVDGNDLTEWASLVSYEEEMML